MDLYEEAMEKMSEMSEKQLDALIYMQKKRICICRDCPTYNQCADENMEGLFCILGQSGCELDKGDCRCLECPAHDNFQMKYESYCVEGSEEEQRAKIL